MDSAAMPPWLRYYGSPCTTAWALPLEFYQAALFLSLFVVRARLWAFGVNAIALGGAAGILSTHHFALTAWVTGVCSAVGLASSVLVERETTSNASTLRRGERRLLLLSGGLAVALVGQWLHYERVLAKTEVVAEDRLVKWYERRVGSDVPHQLSVDVFVDYQCPACRATLSQILDAVTRHGGIVHVRDFPLDAKCNHGIPTLHPAACEAALAMRLARSASPESVAEMQSWLFANQSILTSAMIQLRLRSLRLGDGVNADLASHQRGLQDDIELARHLEIDATPTVVVNGVRLPGGPVARLEALMAHVADAR
jgi:hypothetical protein